MKLCIILLICGAASCSSAIISHDDDRTNKLEYLMNDENREQPPNVVVETTKKDEIIGREKTFIDLYHDGVRSYLANDWPSCVDELEKSLAGYRDYYQATASCRSDCSDLGRRQKPLFEENVDNLHVFEAMIRKTSCMTKCKRHLLANLPDFFFMDKWSQNLFRMRTPYEYLQLCYYRAKNMIGAASATYTALLGNPADDMMKKNLKFYLDLLGTEHSGGFKISDLEQKRFAHLYIDGLLAYQKEDWQSVIDHMEASLQQYVYDEDECRYFCEGEFDQGWHADFITATANHFTYCLRCKMNCTIDLSIVRGKFYEDIFATHYEYLHIAYYRVGNPKAASKAASSFELLKPGTADMQENLSFYRDMPGTDASFFVPRREAKLYFQRQRYEQKLMEFIAVEFSGGTTRTNDYNRRYGIDDENVDGALLQATKDADNGHGLETKGDEAQDENLIN